jgi:dolichol kinase
MVKRAVRKHSTPNIETLLWLSLGVFTLVKTWHWIPLIPIIHVLVLIVLRTTSDPSTYSHHEDASGNIMSIVLTPSLFMSVHKPVYAVFASSVAIIFHHDAPPLLRMISAVTLFWTNSMMSNAWNEPVAKSFLSMFLWIIIGKGFQKVPSESFTPGERLVVSTILAVAVTEGIITSTQNSVMETTLFTYTAIAGLCGCTVAVTSVDQFARENVVIRLIYIAILSLGTVEIFFWYHYIHDDYPLPRCLFWIFGDFLMQVEDPQQIQIQMDIPKLPRMAWLVYWGIAMTVTIPLAPGSNAHPILSRKWFHLIAVLLFVPGTVLAPQLQSLSYAVALAVLLVLESTRHLVPWLNEFYKTYLDSSKCETETSTIVSHMALIVGCATPLWISQWISSSSSTSGSSSTLLLTLWGVWTLGIADAMGAVVGKNWGSFYWGTNHRTVEGSSAMFLSLCMACHWTCSYDKSTPSMTPWTVWVPAAFFVTLIEAFTTQIDNLILPLAGTVVLLLLSR